MKASPPRPGAPSLTAERSTERGRRRDTHRSAVLPQLPTLRAVRGSGSPGGADGCAPTTDDGGPRVPGRPGSNPSLPGQWRCRARGREGASGGKAENPSVGSNHTYLHPPGKPCLGPEPPLPGALLWGRPQGLRRGPRFNPELWPGPHRASYGQPQPRLLCGDHPPPPQHPTPLCARVSPGPSATSPRRPPGLPLAYPPSFPARGWRGLPG